ncbi:MAG TPA: PTS sugar transporter subunit IIA [Planctomycetota bacterium]|nr:PTS sugar transporter subunit IIA [Planctomycetota bacterium]
MKLVDLIPKKAILHSIKVKDKKAAVHELVQAARKAHDGERFSVADIVDGIMAREKIGSTGLGGGVGIPHAKLDGIKGVIGAFARVPEGVEFQAVDGERVQLRFLILAPPSKNDDYLKALQKVMTAIKKPNFLKFLRASKSVKDIEEIFREVEEPAPV